MKYNPLKWDLGTALSRRLGEGIPFLSTAFLLVALVLWGRYFPVCSVRGQCGTAVAAKKAATSHCPGNKAAVSGRFELCRGAMVHKCC